MPVYEYEHQNESCDLGLIFEVSQPMDEKALSKCPHCGQGVRKIVSRINISCPKGNSELKDMGFTKLVKRERATMKRLMRLFSKNTCLCKLARGSIGTDTCPVLEG